MDFSKVASLRENGFEGFLTVAELVDRYREIPDEMGVYLVVTPDDFTPDYVDRGTGGFFKGRDPNILTSILADRWVEGARVVNIGKAGGASSLSTLRKRLREYVRFGRGQAVGHWGGRYIWQLRACHSLQVCWKIIETEPREVERQLIMDFVERFGVRPFANLQD